MRKDFYSLINKYGEAGAREKFEDICYKIIRADLRDHKVNTVRCAPGDDGIDVLAKKDGHKKVYQCKFFKDNIGSTQKTQIKDSLNSLMNSQHSSSVVSWTLCIPIELSSKEMLWWEDWSKDVEDKYNIEVDILDGKDLISLAEDHGLYEKLFKVITIDSDIINDDKEYVEKLKPLVTHIANQDFAYTNGHEVSWLEDIVNEYEMDPKFANSSLISNISYLLRLVVESVHDGKIKDDKILKEIYKIRKSIVDEYRRLFVKEQ